MRRRQVLVFAAGAAAVWGSGLGAVSGATSAWAAPAASSWGKAIGVPGLGVLNKGGDANVASLSCGQAGTCAAGGDYRDGQKHRQGFVALEKKGRWGKAIEVPGLGALNKGGNAGVVSMSCGPAGSCTAAGTYTDGSAHSEGFVTSEKNGSWGKAIEVPGLAALNAGGNARVSQASCAPAANCVVGGSYTDADGHAQGFVAGEKNGKWGQAIEVSGLGALNAGGNAGVSSVSCATANNCTAVGDYADGSGNEQGFAATEKNGKWGQAIEVPGLETLNASGSAGVLTVSCATPGNCSAGGDYFDSDDSEQGFVADQKNGVWAEAIEVPGLGPLNASNNSPLAFVGSIACAAPGNCTATGEFGWPYSWVFMASEKNGVWGQAASVSISASLAVGRSAEAGSVACASTGNCVTGGDAENMTRNGDFSKAYLVVQQHGQWAEATAVPNLANLSKASTSVGSVSCASGGKCTASGSFTDSHNHSQGFVTQGS